MGDLIVRQPHLGRELIGLLGRIVDSQDDGLTQDDIEPYLLVRLLRCGYIRRQSSDGSSFVATPAGIERWRLETIAARRRQDDIDRREIIRGRLQATIARMALDYPVAPLPPTLRDFKLPEIYQRQWPPMREPQLPPARPTVLRVKHDERPRQLLAPEDALSLIRESEQRTIRDGWPPVALTGGVLLPSDEDLPIVTCRPAAGEARG